MTSTDTTSTAVGTEEDTVAGAPEDRHAPGRMPGRRVELFVVGFFGLGLLVGLLIGFAVWGGSGSTSSSSSGVVIEPAGPDQQVVELVSRGVELQRTGDRDGAAAIYRQAIDIDPTYPLPHFNLGVISHEDGDLAEAIAAYRRAIDADGTFLSARFNLAIASRDLGDTETAIAEFEAGAISDRIRRALAAAKVRGTRLGNPRWPEILPQAAQASAVAGRRRARERALAYADAIELARRTGARTYEQIAARLTERGLTPPGGPGARWHPSTVRRVMQRIAEQEIP